MVRVSRLDGPTAADAGALIDRAIAAENTGPRGRAYVDIANRDATGDAWFEAAARQLVELGFDTVVDREPGTFPPHARFDAPVREIMTPQARLVTVPGWGHDLPIPLIPRIAGEIAGHARGK